MVLQSSFPRVLASVGLVKQAAAQSCSAVAQAGRSEFSDPGKFPFLPAEELVLVCMCWKRGVDC